MATRTRRTSILPTWNAPSNDAVVDSPVHAVTNAFSKKVENHAAMVALYFMYYNFARVHQTLRVTPAMEAGLSDHVWSIEEIVSLLTSA
jgi:hypothetical protein